MSNGANIKDIEETDANEVMPNVWVGSGSDAYEVKDNPKYHLICVLEQKPVGFLKNFSWLPVLSKDEEGFDVARMESLDVISSEIDKLLARGFIVVVFCGAGMERSPLAVAWYVHKTVGINIEDAYCWVKKHRRITTPRMEWIKED